MSVIHFRFKQIIPRYFGQLRQQTSSRSSQSANIKKLLRRQIPDPPQNLKLCTSASKCERYNLGIAMSELSGHGLNPSIDSTNEAVHVKLGDGEVIVLSSGAVVAWNMDEVNVRNKVLGLLANAEINTFSDIETEDMDYVEEETGPDVQSGMIGDVIYVHGESDEARLRDKIAFSTGLARHTKLSALEVRAEALTKRVRVISKHMAAGKDTRLSHKDVHMLTGRILQLRGALNLYSEITETPDIYWTEPELERLYELISRKLDVAPRIEILNKKFDYIADMVSILRSHLSERTSLRLEWMIIALISVEVVFELRHIFT